MKYLLSILFFIVAKLAVSQPLSQEVIDFGTNPGNLSLFYYTPQNAKPGRPLVVVLHGCSQGANAVAELTGWNKLADKYGFYVAYPQQHFPNNPSHCFNWFKKNEIERGKGESESIKQMVDYMLKKFQLNSDSVFVTGLSAGAAMSVVMIATQPGMFKAAAVFAGGPYKPGTNIFTSSGSMVWGVNKTPEEWKELVWRENPAFKTKYPKVFVYHGTTDPVVNVRNAYELLEQWTCLHKTDTIPDIVDSAYLEKRDIMRLAYLNKENDEVVVFYKINNMGHAIPVDPGQCGNQGGKAGIFGTIKNFYATYYAACDFGLVPDWKTQRPAVIAVNGSATEFKVKEKSAVNYEWILNNACEAKSDKNRSSITVSFKNPEGKLFLKEKTSEGCIYYHQPINAKAK